MKRICFVGLFLCLTTFLLSQLNRVPSPSATAQNFPAIDQQRGAQNQGNPCVNGSEGPSGQTACPSSRHGRAVRRHSGLRVRPDSTYTTQVSGETYCNLDYSTTNFSSDDIYDISAWGDGDTPLPISLQPTPVIEASCGLGFDPSNGGGSVGSQRALVWGGADVDVSCVVATGVCSANVDGEVKAYSMLLEGYGPPLGSLSFSGTSSAAQMEYYTDPTTGLIGNFTWKL